MMKLMFIATQNEFIIINLVLSAVFVIAMHILYSKLSYTDVYSWLYMFFIDKL